MWSLHAQKQVGYGTYEALDGFKCYARTLRQRDVGIRVWVRIARRDKKVEQEKHRTVQYYTRQDKTWDGRIASQVSRLTVFASAACSRRLCSAANRRRACCSVMSRRHRRRRVRGQSYVCKAARCWAVLAEYSRALCCTSLSGTRSTCMYVQDVMNGSQHRLVLSHSTCVPAQSTMCEVLHWLQAVLLPTLHRWSWVHDPWAPRDGRSTPARSLLAPKSGGRAGGRSVDTAGKPGCRQGLGLRASPPRRTADEAGVCGPAVDDCAAHTSRMAGQLLAAKYIYIQYSRKQQQAAGGRGFSCNADAGPRDARCRNRATGGDGASWATSDRPGGGGRGSKGRGWRRRHHGTARAAGNSGGSGAHLTRGS